MAAPFTFVTPEDLSLVSANLRVGFFASVAWISLSAIPQALPTCLSQLRDKTRLAVAF